MSLRCMVCMNLVKTSFYHFLLIYIVFKHVRVCSSSAFTWSQHRRHKINNEQRSSERTFRKHFFCRGTARLKKMRIIIFLYNTIHYWVYRLCALARRIFTYSLRSPNEYCMSTHTICMLLAKFANISKRENKT